MKPQYFIPLMAMVGMAVGKGLWLGSQLVMPRLADALTGQTHPVQWSATPLESYYTTSTAGQLAAQAAAEARAQQDADYKKQAQERDRITRLKRAVDEAEAREMARQ